MIRSPWKKDSTRSLLHVPAGSCVVTRAAIRVPTTAVPTLVPTSWAVSLSAVPIEVRLLGIASTRATAQIVMTVRSPIVITTMQAAMAAYPWSTPHERPSERAGQADRPDQAGDAVAELLGEPLGQGRRGDHRHDDRQVGQTGLHRAPPVGVLEVEDQAEHHAGHRDRRPDLGDRGATDGAVGEEIQVQHGCGGTAFVPHEREACDDGADDRGEGDRGEPAVAARRW